VSETERFDETNSLSLGGGNRAIKPGDIIGGAYILKSLLGHGGMGYVFLAEHNIIKKDYALKIIRPQRQHTSYEGKDGWFKLPGLRKHLCKLWSPELEGYDQRSTS
jgi:serine/threonine protein kinase